MDLVVESREDLVAALGRHDEVRVLPDVLADRVPVFSKAEEVGLLLDQGLRVVGAFARGDVGFLESLFAGDAVVGLVVALVDVLLVVDLLIDLLGEVVMARLRGPDEIGVGDPQAVVDPVEGLRFLIDEVLARLSGLLGRVLNLQPMLIEADQEPGVLSLQAGGTGVEVRQHLFVGVSHVRDTVGVINRRGDVEVVGCFAHGCIVCRTGAVL